MKIITKPLQILMFIIMTLISITLYIVMLTVMIPILLLMGVIFFIGFFSYHLIKTKSIKQTWQKIRSEYLVENPKQDVENNIIYVDFQVKDSTER